MKIEELIKKALEEDLRDGDHTSLATIPSGEQRKVSLYIKENGVLAGLYIARQVFQQADPGIKIHFHMDDGQEVRCGDVAFTAEGDAISLLSAERLALNFMQRMSGIATHTRRLVNLIENTGARILDTRKTTPLLRELEKYAVRIGGAQNHRMGLYDMIMIKDNHIDFAGGIPQAIHATQSYLSRKDKHLKIEIEVRNFKELNEVLECGGIDRIMLDNFRPDDLKEAIKRIDGRYETEASGGINEENIREYALSGIDYISVGALTHHIRSLDMSLKAV